jgi:SsrA-binding protein
VPKPKAPTKGPARKLVAQNRRARHDYEILDTVECGIVLAGSEVKSLREGTSQLKEAFARAEDNEIWVYGFHIPPYAQAGGYGFTDPDRRRKLLLHRRQIDEWADRVARESVTMIPLSVYFKEGRAKLELALARGRKHYDKRQAIARRDSDREAERAHRSRQKQ